MIKALELAEKALSQGEFPVGCVITQQDRIIAQGRRSESKNTNEIEHAEINALRHFYNLNLEINHGEVSIFCTMEPCLMCFGAILLNPKIKEIVFAYEDVMGGGTQLDLSVLPPLYRNRKITITPHLLRQESLALFKTFFADQHNTYWRSSLLAEYTLRAV